MSKFEITQRATDGGTFAAQAFDGSIGKTVPLATPRGVGEATLVSAMVAEDGRSARLTFDLDGADDLLDLPTAQGFSIGYSADRLVARRLPAERLTD